MSKPVLLSGGNGKVTELVGTANGQFLVNDGNNDVVFSSATTPTAGQVPVWSGSAWAPGTISPGGGGGGGGLTYLLNYSVAGASPTPSGTWKQLSLTPTTGAYNTGAGAVTAPNGGTYANLADFVTPLTEPGATTTPPGFWDLNVYLTSTGAADETLFRFSIHKWDGTTLSAPIATSANVSITDPAARTLYTASVFVPSTVLSATERIAIKVEVTRTTANAHAVTGYFEGVYYTHMHTTLGAPGSTGLVKVVNGIIQAPATLLVNADVSDTAAILVSKISGAAPLASPTFTGTVTIPAGASIDGFAPLASPTFTGTPLSTTAAVDTNTTQIATTAYVVGQGYLKSATASTTYAPLASPTFTGTVTIPAGASISGYLTTASAASTYAPLASPTFTGTVTIPAGASISGYAPLASPTFSGTPSLPTGTTGVTQSAGNNTTALATTAFVTTAVATATGTPYDLPAEIPGTPATSTKVVNFKAVRSFTLASSGHQGGCAVTNPTGSAVSFTVKKNGSSSGVGGTITFNTNGTFSSSITQTSFIASDLLTVETPSAVNGMDTPYFTLAMTLA